MPGGRLSAIVGAARRGGRELLLETEALALVDSLGLATPERLFLRDPSELREGALGRLPGEQLVLKIVAPGLAHKTELGGVALVRREPHAVAEAAAAMWRRLQPYEPVGLLLCERVEHSAGLGAEILLALRWTDDFGPVVTLGPGGVDAEYLSRRLDGGWAPVHLSAGVLETAGRMTGGRKIGGRKIGGLGAALAGKSFLSLVTGSHRGRPPVAGMEDLLAVARRLLERAGRAMPGELAEIEINPLVFREGRAVALDALVRLGGGEREVDPPRPLARLGKLLAPSSIAIVGVSTALNPGRIVLENVLDSGFDRRRVHLVKPGHETLAGCRCYPEIAALPEPVDLAVLCVAAAALPAAVDGFVSSRMAESLILIAGGLGESPGSEAPSRALRRTIRAARETEWGGPVVNGGNCLGVRSVPGRYDTLFIPRHKLSYPDTPPTPLALISQSGAFAVARASRLAELNPRYVVSVGNQIDLTLGDYLTYLADDDEVRVFACYLEGFQPGDGARWLEAASRIVASGRVVVLYRAGRTSAGSRAAASHTASIAGDYAVTRELSRAVGVLVADELEDFEDLVRVACALDRRALEGRRLGALSNAGFECVAVADGAGSLELPELAPRTAAGLDELFARYRLSSIVAARNPLDVTPIVDDEAFAEAAGLMLEDPNVDLGLVSCVPLTGALQTLAAGRGHAENAASDSAVARRLGRLWHETEKAWVAAVDGGSLYDEMARVMTREGIPVFRSVDRALRLLDRYAEWRLR